MIATIIIIINIITFIVVGFFFYKKNKINKKFANSNIIYKVKTGNPKVFKQQIEINKQDIIYKDILINKLKKDLLTHLENSIIIEEIDNNDKKNITGTIYLVDKFN